LKLWRLREEDKEEDEDEELAATDELSTRTKVPLELRRGACVKEEDGIEEPLGEGVAATTATEFALRTFDRGEISAPARPRRQEQPKPEQQYAKGTWAGWYLELFSPNSRKLGSPKLPITDSLPVLKRMTTFPPEQS
jgi:hypothetical protein